MSSDAYIQINMKGVILAGGTGSRLRPLTSVANKHLLPIYNKPMIEYPIGTLKTFGVTEILIVTGGEYIGRFAELLGDGAKYGCEFTFKVQTKALGIADALRSAESFVDGRDVLVCLGDNIFDNEKLKDIDFTWDDGNAYVFGKAVHDPQRFGVPKFHRDGSLKIIEEKPHNPGSSYAITGLYKYPAEVFNVIKLLEPSNRGEYEITDVNNAFLQSGKLKFQELKGFWSDAGTFNSLLECSNWAKETWETKLNEPINL